MAYPQATGRPAPDDPLSEAGTSSAKIHQLRTEYTKFNNRVLERALRARLTSTEWTVFVYVLRVTHGYHRDQTNVSLTSIASETGLDKASISRAMTSLIRRRIILEHTGCSGSRARILGINRDADEWLQPGGKSSSCRNDNKPSRCQSDNKRVDESTTREPSSVVEVTTHIINKAVKERVKETQTESVCVRSRFDEFYELYPGKKNPNDARYWASMDCHENPDEVINGLKNQIHERRAKVDAGLWVPEQWKLMKNWLLEKKWQDTVQTPEQIALEARQKQGRSGTNQRVSKDPDPAEYAEIIAMHLHGLPEGIRQRYNTASNQGVAIEPKQLMSREVDIPAAQER